MIKKWWARFIISGLIYGIIAEIISVSSDKEIHPIITFLIIFGIYFLLSFIHGMQLRKDEK